MTEVHESLRPCVDAAVAAGFDVHAPKRSDHQRTEAARFVYITRADQPGCALLQIGEFPSLGMAPTLSVPVRPDREHGSAVAVDFDGRPESIAAVLEPVVASKTVVTRFVRQPRVGAVDRRVPEETVLVG